MPHFSKSAAFVFSGPFPDSQKRAHCLLVDTFNFSFFDDKPQESKSDAEETSSSSTPAASENEGQTDTDEDPFGFDAFDLSESAPETETDEEEDFDLTLDTPDEPTPTSKNDDADKFDLSSLSAGIRVNESLGGDNFPGLSLALPSSKSDFDGFDDLQLDSEKQSSDTSFDDLALEPTPQTSATSLGDFDLELEDANSVRDNANQLRQMGFDDSLSLPEPEPISESEPLQKLEPLTKHETEDFSLPLDPTEIRASVTPAIFLEPTPPAQESKKKPSGQSPSTREEGAKAKLARFLTTDDPYGEVAPPRARLRVAILGASGIGRNHARWFARHSCDVVSFLGSSDESVERTQSQLQTHMGFEGQGYSDLGRLLSETQPQAICIASPSPLHYVHAMQCLEAGTHVLCEKPLVYAPKRSKRENMDGARELLKAATKRNLVLATQLQYGSATPILCRLAGVSPFEVGDFAMEIETSNSKSPRDPKELWVDLAPHPLSVAQYLGGDGAEIVQETLQLLPSRSAYTTEVTARFGVRSAEGRLIMCRIIVRWFDKGVDNREPRRRFSFNGRIVQYSGVKSPDGTYMAQYVAPDGYISHYSDPVDYLIGNFVRTCWQEDQLILSSEQGVQNLDWLLSTAEKL